MWKFILNLFKRKKDKTNAVLFEYYPVRQWTGRSDNFKNIMRSQFNQQHPVDSLGGVDVNSEKYLKAQAAITSKIVKGENPFTKIEHDQGLGKTQRGYTEDRYDTPVALPHLEPENDVVDFVQNFDCSMPDNNDSDNSTQQDNSIDFGGGTGDGGGSSGSWD